MIHNAGDAVRVNVGRWATVLEVTVTLSGDVAWDTNTARGQKKKRIRKSVNERNRDRSNSSSTHEAPRLATPELNSPMWPVSCLPVRRRSLSSP